MLSSLTSAKRLQPLNVLHKRTITTERVVSCSRRSIRCFRDRVQTCSAQKIMSALLPLKATATLQRTKQWYLRPNTTHRRVCAQCAQTRFEVFEMKKHFFYRFRFAGKVFEIHSEAQLDVDARSALFWETEYFESFETADCAIQVRRAEPPAACGKLVYENAFFRLFESGEGFLQQTLDRAALERGEKRSNACFPLRRRVERKRT